MATQAMAAGTQPPRDATAPGVNDLRATDDGHAAELLARAFHRDPMMTYLVPDDVQRDRRSLPFFRAGIAYCRRYGVTKTSLDNDGVAIWMRPGYTTITFGRMLRTGLLFAPLRFGWSGFGRFINIVSFTDTLHAQAVEGPHWYLLGIGVEPACQGHGIGSQLLADGLRRSDADGLPCYLETMNPANLPFYRQHGFEIAAEGDVPKGGPHVWVLVREPRT